LLRHGGFGFLRFAQICLDQLNRAARSGDLIAQRFGRADAGVVMLPTLGALGCEFSG
jgi:hypothetical protein